MTQEQATLISSITAIVSSVAAIIAICIAVFVEKRTNKRFSEQLEREERLALANLKPLLAVYPSKFINHKAVHTPQLWNRNGCNNKHIILQR
jgi:hypothetical protein